MGVSVSIRYVDNSEQFDNSDKLKISNGDQSNISDYHHDGIIVSLFLKNPNSMENSHRKLFTVSNGDIKEQAKGVLDFIRLENFEEYVDKISNMATFGVMIS